MAFVKLPDSHRFLDDARRGEFILFVGAAEEIGDGGLRLVSPWETHQLAPGDVPIDFRPGEVAAVLAIAPTHGETGPIIAAANLDTDERADLLAREPEILAILGRRAGPGAGGGAVAHVLGRALISAAPVAIAVYGVAVAGLALMRRPGAAAEGDLLGLLQSALATPSLDAAAPAGLAAVIAFGAGVVRAALRLRGTRRRARGALDRAWRRATDVFVFARRHADVFRLAPRLDRAPQRAQPPRRSHRVDGRVVAQQRGDVRWPDHLTSS